MVKLSIFLQLVSAAIGHKPNTDIFKDITLDETGYIVNIPEVQNKC
jgi:thioredoxin reductase